MHKLLSLILGVFLFSVASVYAGSFRKDDRFWDVLVHQTKIKQQADLIVYEVPSFSEALGHDEFWKWSQEGSIAVSFTPHIEAANLVIYITHDKKEAGWRRRLPLYGHLRE